MNIFFLQVIGHRQAGKSTIVALLDHYIAEKKVCVGSTVLESIGICLNRNTPLVRFWKYMLHFVMHFVHGADGFCHVL